MKTRLMFGVAALASASLITAPTGHALLPSISPGDQIDYISDHQSQTFCTLGYVYTGDDQHVYGVTAGHCRPGMPGYMRDQNSRTTGIFVRISVSPSHTGGPDYGLIDFGLHVMAVPFIGDTPVSDAAVQPPLPGETVCHSGVSSGQHCGTVARAYGDDQYLANMPASIPGDSGGPVWYRDSDGAAHVIGIWLGEKDSAGDRYGRFAALATGLSILT
jgi:streptogrisin B